MGKRFAIVIGVAAAGVMALGTQTATALPHYQTNVTIIVRDSWGYLGRVHSEVRKCLDGRKVVLFKQRPGADRRLGKDRSHFVHGEHHRFTQWGIFDRGWEGRLYAKVMPKRRDWSVCRADRSPIYRDRARPDAAGVMALGAQPATALPTYNTRLTIAKDQCCYHGRVYSEVHKCKPGRKVVLFKQRPGADRRLGKDRSFIYGARQFAEWLIERGPRWEGRHQYAKVMPKVGDGFRCRADRSRIYRERARPDAAGVMALGTQTAAAADVVEYETKLKIDAGGQGYVYIRVTSEARKCWGRRTVVLFEKRPGADRRLGSTETVIRYGRGDASPTKRSLNLGRGRHRLYAKVLREERDGFVCLFDRSNSSVS